MLNSLFSKTKRRLLTLLFLNPDRQFYLIEIARQTGISQGTLHREIKPLVRDGILQTEKRANQTFYSVNKSNPVYRELQAIVIKTFGITDALKETLSPVRAKIRVAFIYGSIAKGDDTAKSDIDLMIIGKLSFVEASAALDKAEASLGRTINPTIYPVKEFRDKIKGDNHFINSVMKSPINFLIGSQDELRKMAGT